MLEKPMYIKELYSPNTPGAVHELIGRHPLATIVSRQADGLTANYVPLVLQPHKGPHGTLMGHMARANPQCEALRNDPRVLDMFTGAAGYVSSSWYSHRDCAPTWNFEAVHCHGRLTFSVNDEHTLWTIQVLLDRMETGEQNPWKMSELGAEGIQRRLPFIIGFEILIERVEAKFQMSQYERVEAIAELKKRGDNEVAQAMLECNRARVEIDENSATKSGVS
jgi:transcriptional regulator